VPFLYLVIAAVAIAVAVFALQNAEQVTIRFLAWQVERAPLAAVILISVAAGAVAVSLPGFVQRWRLRSEIRRLEARVRELEAGQPAAADTEAPEWKSGSA
jgi:putative membrane protein